MSTRTRPIDRPASTGWAILVCMYTLGGCAAQTGGDAEAVAESEQPLYVDAPHLWGSDVLSVCWESTTTANAPQRAIVEKAVQDTWQANSRLQFKFNQTSACGGSGANIRIKISDEQPHTQALGTALDHKSSGMVLNFTFENWFNTVCSVSAHPDKTNSCIRKIAVHEFGHALGFAHEQNRPDTPSTCDQAQGTNGTITVGDWDLMSVMNYCNPSWNNAGNLSAGDIAGLHRFYGLRTLVTGGTSWGSGNYATQIAFGDVDGDGRDEIGIVRYATSGPRFWILDDEKAGFATLFSGGDSWGSGAYATGIAFGDVDGDGRAEFAITRKTDTNARYYVYDDSAAGFALMYSGGSSWGSSAYATALAFGDVDGDGRDELVIGRYSTSNDRYYVLDDSRAGFATLFSGGSNWGADSYPTAFAFGDVDGDGRDELAMARYTTSNDRYYVLDDSRNKFATMFSGGSNWGSSAYATGIALGDVDHDGRAELGVARNSNTNARYYVFDDSVAGFANLLTGGSGWGDSASATSIAFGDVDGDGYDEIFVGRVSSTNDRFYLLDDARTFSEIASGGSWWGGSAYPTSAAFGDVDGDGKAELGYTRYTDANDRYAVQRWPY